MHIVIIVVMGVSGSGKSTLGRQLATTLNYDFYDADPFHPAANVAKMRQGIPLTDADRDPWLQQLRAAIAQWQTTQQNVVLACSALKASYRRHLDPNGALQWVYLKGSAELLQERLQQRQDHFMPAQLLHSQLAALEEPQNAILVSAALPLATQVEQVRAKLHG